MIHHVTIIETSLKTCPYIQMSRCYTLGLNSRIGLFLVYLHKVLDFVENLHYLTCDLGFATAGANQRVIRVVSRGLGF